MSTLADCVRYGDFRNILAREILNSFEFDAEHIRFTLSQFKYTRFDVSRLRATIERARHYAAGEILANHFETANTRQEPSSHCVQVHDKILAFNLCRNNLLANLVAEHNAAVDRAFDNSPELF